LPSACSTDDPGQRKSRSRGPFGGSEISHRFVVRHAPNRRSCPRLAPSYSRFMAQLVRDRPNLHSDARPGVAFVRPRKIFELGLAPGYFGTPTVRSTALSTPRLRITQPAVRPVFSRRPAVAATDRKLLGPIRPDLAVRGLCYRRGLARRGRPATYSRPGVHVLACRSPFCSPFETEAQAMTAAP